MDNSFDPVADLYDETFSNTRIGKAQRDIVWKYLRKKNLINKNILELNCGTGVDAIYLAQKNRVTATDASEVMLGITEAKIYQDDLQSNCKTILWNLNDQFTGDKEEKYDLIFSNFGGLNCISPEALKNLSSELYSLLKPGGEMIFVVMGRKCLWESFYFLLKGKFRSIFRRRKKEALIALIGENSFIKTWYYSPKQLKRILETNFNFTLQKPVGFFIPPSYLESYFKQKKGFLRFLVRMERSISSVSILSNYADHYLMQLVKK